MELLGYIVQCVRHPRNRFKRAPSTGCPVCATIYNFGFRLRNGLIKLTRRTNGLGTK